MAAPDQLEELFKTLLGLLLEDARPNGHLNIGVTEEGGQAHYRFASNGPGLSPEKLRAVVQGAAGLLVAHGLPGAQLHVDDLKRLSE